MIVITGPGRSGTSFLADLYRRLRFDPGGAWGKDIRAGFEDAEIVAINSKLCQELQAPAGPRPWPALGTQRWARVGELAESFGPELRELAAQREVVKDPRFCWTLRIWLEAKAPIDHLILTFRRVDDVIGSARHAGMAQEKRSTEEQDLARSIVIYRMGSLITAVGEYGVPYTLLWFPDYLADADALYEALAFPAPVERKRFLKVFRNTVDTKLVHFGLDRSSSAP